MSTSLRRSEKKSDTTCRLYQTEPLVRHVEMYTKTDTTRRLYPAEPLVGLRHVEMWPTVEEDKIMRSHDQRNVEVDMIMIMSTLDIGIDRRIRILNLFSTNKKPDVLVGGITKSYTAGWRRLTVNQAKLTKTIVFLPILKYSKRVLLWQGYSLHRMQFAY